MPGIDEVLWATEGDAETAFIHNRDHVDDDLAELRAADEADTVDEIRATLVENHCPSEGDQHFAELAAAVLAGVSGIANAIQTCLEYGFDQTNDVDGPNYEVMAQMVYDRFLKVS